MGSQAIISYLMSNWIEKSELLKNNNDLSFLEFVFEDLKNYPIEFVDLSSKVRIRDLVQTIVLNPLVEEEFKIKVLTYFKEQKNLKKLKYQGVSTEDFLEAQREESFKALAKRFQQLKMDNVEIWKVSKGIHSKVNLMTGEVLDQKESPKDLLGNHLMINQFYKVKTLKKLGDIPEGTELLAELKADTTLVLRESPHHPAIWRSAFLGTDFTLII